MGSVLMTLKLSSSEFMAAGNANGSVSGAALPLQLFIVVALLLFCFCLVGGSTEWYEAHQQLLSCRFEQIRFQSRIQESDSSFFL